MIANINKGDDTNNINKLIDKLEILKAEIEWDYSIEYQVIIDEVIKILKKEIMT